MDADSGILSDLSKDLSDEQHAYVEFGREWQRTEGGYAHERATKPHTLAVGLGDSPAGLAAWLVETLRAWSDCGGDIESVLTRDELLTWVMAYWVTGTISTSFAPYAERTPASRALRPAHGFLRLPT